MLNSHNYLVKNLLLIVLTTSVLIASCKKKDEPEPEPPTTTGTLSGAVTSSSAGTGLSDARIVVFDANTNAPVGITITSDVNGNYSSAIASGNYFVKVYRQGYNAIPVPGVSAIPFTVSTGATTTNNYQMTTSSITNGGFITGKVTSGGLPMAGVMVVANDGTNGYSSISDLDGNYYIYNVPAGTYNMVGWIVGYNSDPSSVTVSSNTESPNTAVTLTSGATGSVSGTVTNLAIDAMDVDVSLTDPYTKETIPGLSTMTVGQNYSFSNLPNGTYLARATYKNDLRCMDPDWIIKNGEPFVTVSGGPAIRDFSITGAVTINSPTNEATDITPVQVSGSTPTFTWTAYPSTSDYVIEVMNSNGDVIWGGFSSTGTKNFTIASNTTSVVYNYNSTATESLVSGQVYRWKIYASMLDLQSASGWRLISASEDQLGLFIVQ